MKRFKNKFEEMPAEDVGSFLSLSIPKRELLLHFIQSTLLYYILMAFDYAREFFPPAKPEIDQRVRLN